MVDYLRFIGSVTGSLTATTGTIACGNAERVNFQVILDTNSGYDIAVKPVQVATGTASKSNCAAVLTNNGVYEARRTTGSGNWWIARQNYNGATAASGGTYDKYTMEQWG